VYDNFNRIDNILAHNIELRKELDTLHKKIKNNKKALEDLEKSVYDNANLINDVVITVHGPREERENNGQRER